MVFLAIALYFFLACLLSWLALFPVGRTRTLRLVAGTGAHLRKALAHARRRRAARLTAMAMALRHGTGWLRRHYGIGLATVAVVLLPVLLALWASNKTMLGGFAVSTRAMNGQVAALLQGEQLVPPAALPPLVFGTREVEQLRPMLVSASRNWDLLNPAYAQRLLLVFKIMKEQHGYDMAILEGYRSPERQNLLAAMGANVTNAAAFQSWHQYGLAADCAFLRDGKLVISEKDDWAMHGYQLYGAVAESVGLTWGGRWRMMDFGHTELRLPGVMKRS